MKFPALIILAALLAMSCKKAATEEPQVCINNCMQTMIDSAMANPKGYVLNKIDAYQYKSNTVYLYYAGCCDRYNELKDGNCNYLFAPSGGATGGGDNQHLDFFKEAKFIMTVWVDPRL